MTVFRTKPHLHAHTTSMSDIKDFKVRRCKTHYRTILTLQGYVCGNHTDDSCTDSTHTTQHTGTLLYCSWLLYLHADSTYGQTTGNRKEVCSNRLSIVAFRASGAGVRASAPSLLTRPPPSPTAHGHLQNPKVQQRRKIWTGRET